MDAQRFDRFAMSLAARASRRQLLRGLAALGLGSGVLGSSQAAARQAPGGSDGSGATIERTDAVCKGRPALSNKMCVPSSCSSSNPACACAESVSGSKKCVFPAFSCPPVDECDRNRDCPPGGVCVKLGACCGGSRNNVCLPACG